MYIYGQHNSCPLKISAMLRKKIQYERCKYFNSCRYSKYSQWYKRLGYTWHESEDMHTGYLVKTKIHNSVAHSGGIERLKYELSLYNTQKLLHKQRMYKILKQLQGDS